MSLLNRFLVFLVLFLFPMNGFFIDFGFRILPLYFISIVLLFLFLFRTKLSWVPLDVRESVLLVFFLVALLGSPFSYSSELSFRFVLGLFLVSSTYFLCRSFLLNNQILFYRYINAAFIAFTSLSILFYLIGLKKMNLLMEHSDFFGVTIEKGIPRMIGLNNDPNICALAMLIMFFYFLYQKGLLAKVLMLFSGAAVILTLSRGGFIAILAGLFATFIIAEAKSKFKIIAFFSGIVFLAVLVISSNYEFFSLFIEKRINGIESGGGRFEVWGNALELFYKKPLFGYGIFSFVDLSNNVYGIAKYAHNTYLEVLVETGLVGFVIFLFFICITIVTSYKNSLNLPHARFLFPLNVSFFVCIIGLSMYINTIFWFLLLINFLVARRKL
jgi:O-antigen ligase